MLTRKQIQFTPQQARALRHEASRRGVSESALVREFVTRALALTSASPTPRQRQRLLRAIGRYRSGLSDLSVEHDRYLAEAFADEK
ncbi:MAG TPA: CopG family transcriptional regulator [Candidatus Limnocylindria bacterium]|nr:CopG family transcriptional regulator [Candidatus Limnocylindria bacterium]